MKLAKISKSTTLESQAYDALKEAIVSGQLSPGSRLAEERIAEYLGVSRTPAREAMRRLRQEGIIEYRQNGGYLVPVPSLERVTQITEVRMILEPYAVRLVTARITADELSRLRAAINAEWDAINDTSPGVFVTANCTVRNMLYALSGNEQLIDCIGRYSDHLQFIGTRTLVNPEIRRIAITGHERIFTSIAERDADSAAAATIRQIEAAQKAAEDALLTQ